MPRTSLEKRHMPTLDTVMLQRDAVIAQMGFNKGPSIIQEIGQTLRAIMNNRRNAAKDRVAAARTLIDVLGIGVLTTAQGETEKAPLVNLTLMQTPNGEVKPVKATRGILEDVPARQVTR